MATFECESDVLIILDRAAPSNIMSDQLKLIRGVVDRIDAQIFASGTIRFGIVTFADAPKIEVGWADKLGKQEFLQKLDSIQPFDGQSSFMQAAKLAMEVEFKIILKFLI